MTLNGKSLPVSLSLWDVPMEALQINREMIYKDADAIIILVDLTNRFSLEQAKFIHEEVSVLSLLWDLNRAFSV